jgi:CheY-like chemotaxis protein
MAATGQAGLRALVVENEFWLRLDAEETLLELGHDVVGWADRARTAIAEAERTRPDFVLMDIQLDGVRDGIEAARVIKDAFGIPSLFVTGSADPTLRNRAMRTEPLGYLQKPFAPDELQSALKSFRETANRGASQVPNTSTGVHNSMPTTTIPSSH